MLLDWVMLFCQQLGHDSVEDLRVNSWEKRVKSIPSNQPLLLLFSLEAIS